MRKHEYLVIGCFVIIICLFFQGCERDLTGVSANPDYKVAAFLSDVGDLLIFNPEGNEHEIIAGGLRVGLSWSPVAPKLIYVKESQSNLTPSELYEYDFNTEKSSLLIRDENNLVYNPLFSPDGKKIIYFNGLELVSIDSDGNNKEILYTKSMDQTFRLIGWTNHPNQLLVSINDLSDTTGFYQLFILNTLDKSTEFIMQTKGFNLTSFDGNKWIYSIYQEDAIYMLDIQQKTISTVFDTQAWGIFGVKVSPDREKILFNMQDSLSSVRKIYQINPDGTNFQQLLGFEDATINAIEFFPDGKKILYYKRKLSSSDDVNFYVFDLTTKKSTNLTQGRLGLWTGSGYGVAVSHIEF